ncbi:Protein of unknown function [Bacillus wiedmannii]|nr:Protein of unknown function [Bacillus wiedmannii]
MTYAFVYSYIKVESLGIYVKWLNE